MQAHAHTHTQQKTHNPTSTHNRKKSPKSHSHFEKINEVHRSAAEDLNQLRNQISENKIN